MDPVAVDINNILELEHAFAEDFGTPLFPVLANHYLKNKELKRSRKVCELGLKHSPNNTDGKFILAKLNLYESKITKAEQLLKQVVIENPVHITGLKVLIEVMRSLERSPNSIIKYVNKLLDILPDNEDALRLIKELAKSIPSKPIVKKIRTQQSSAPNKKDATSVKKEVSAEEPKEDFIFNVGIGMATFTMVGVLKSQKHYKQALAVLARLEESGEDTKRIKKERKVLEQLLAKE